MPQVDKVGRIEVWIYIEDEPEKAARMVSFSDESQNELVLHLDNFKLLRIDDEARGWLVNEAFRYLYANYSRLRELWDEYNPRG